MDSGGRFWRLVVAAAAAGVLLRLLLVISAAGDVERHTSPDSLAYEGLGRSLAAGKGFSLGGSPSYERVPGYPLLLAAGRWSFGDRGNLAVLAAQALAVVPTILLLVWALQGRSSRPGLVIAALVLALDPAAVGNSSMLLSDSWIVLFAAAFLGASLRALDAGSIRWSVLAGLASGVGTYFHPGATYLWFIPFVLHLGAGVRTPARRAVLAMAVLAAHLVVLAPWVARNAWLFDDPSLAAVSRKSIVLKAAIIEAYASGGVPLLGLLSGSPSDAEMLAEYRQRFPDRVGSGPGAVARAAFRHPGDTAVLVTASAAFLLLDPGHVAVLKPLGLPLGSGLLSTGLHLSPPLGITALATAWILVLWIAVGLGARRLWALDRRAALLCVATSAYFVAAFSIGALTTGCRYRLAMLPFLAFLAAFAATREGSGPAK